MSYDLLAFTPGAAPAKRADFIVWFTQVLRLRDGHLSTDPAVTTAPLAAWRQDMLRAFPVELIQQNPEADAEDQLMGAEYRFGPDVVYVRLDWRLSRKAQAHALKLARKHMVGLFDVGGDNATVWTVNADGAFVLAHRGETIATDARRETASTRAKQSGHRHNPRDNFEGPKH